MSKSDPDVGHLESVLVPLVQRWQAVRLVDPAVDPSLIAAVIMALVNSTATINYFGGEPLEGAAVSPNPPGSSQTTDVADRLVEVIQRAFPSVRGSVSSLEEP